MTWNKE